MRLTEKQRALLGKLAACPHGQLSAIVQVFGVRIRTFMSLVDRGLLTMTRTPEGLGLLTITDAGRAAITDEKTESHE